MQTEDRVSEEVLRPILQTLVGNCTAEVRKWGTADTSLHPYPMAHVPAVML